MTDQTNPTPSSGGGFLAPKPDAKPVDHCVRCGKETPAGEALCKDHNPHHLSGPSATQMHATVFGGLVLGIIGFFFVARLAVGTTGPFEAQVLSASVDTEGIAAIAYTVTNEGDSEGVADCRVTRDGVPRPDDVAFRSGALAAGETISFERELPPVQPNTQPYDAEALTVVCS